MRAASTRDVAQAISGVIDDVQEGLVGKEVDLSTGLFIHDYVDGGQDSLTQITEVSAELEHGPNGEESFTVKTTDGKTFKVTIQEQV